MIFRGNNNIHYYNVSKTLLQLHISPSLDHLSVCLFFPSQSPTNFCSLHTHILTQFYSFESLQDNNGLEQDLNEAMEKLLEYEKTITKQQRDLDGFSELEERVRNKTCRQPAFSENLFQSLDDCIIWITFQVTKSRSKVISDQQPWTMLWHQHQKLNRRLRFLNL